MDRCVQKRRGMKNLFSIMIVGILAIMVGCSSGTSTKSITFDEEVTEEIVEEVTEEKSQKKSLTK